MKEIKLPKDVLKGFASDLHNASFAYEHPDMKSDLKARPVNYSHGLKEPVVFVEDDGKVTQPAVDFDWKDVSDEEFREYTFKEGHLRINRPVKLAVRPSGNHRIVDEKGVSHIIKGNWLAVSFQPKPGKPDFAF